MKRIGATVWIGCCLICMNCRRAEYFPDKPSVYTGTYLIAHKGNGSVPEANTLRACIEGLNALDGIECDIQMSRNRTIWLSHSPYLEKCGIYSNNCFSTTFDADIVQIDTCLGNEKDYTKLSEVFDYMSQNYPQKVISLDVKAWKPCDISGINLIKEMNILAQKIIDLTYQYHLEGKVMVESETGDFLYYMKTNTSAIETYLSTNGDFELGMSRALKAGFTGISFKYKFLENITKEHVELLHSKGLKIQLWTVNDPIDIEEAMSIKPDYIQTDSMYSMYIK